MWGREIQNKNGDANTLIFRKITFLRLRFQMFFMNIVLFWCLCWPHFSVRSNAHRSATLSTTQMTETSRRGSMQMWHGSLVSKLLHREQFFMFSAAEAMAAPRGSIIFSRLLIKCNAARRADLGPSPGNLDRCWIRLSISETLMNEYPGGIKKVAWNPAATAIPRLFQTFSLLPALQPLLGHH